MTERPAQVLVVGATGGIGRRVVTAAQRRGLSVTALVRDLSRAEKALPGVDLVRGDLERPATLAAAVQRIDAIVFTHGGNGSPDEARRIDYGGVANVLDALDGRTPRIALMTSIGVSRRGAYGGSTGQLLEWKRRSERLVRASGAPYTIVRPGWFDYVGPADDRLVLEQGDTGNGGIGRDQLADVLVRSLLTDAAGGRTFELFAEAGAARSDWDGLFAGLLSDTAGALGGAADPDTLPRLEDEMPLTGRRTPEHADRSQCAVGAGRGVVMRVAIVGAGPAGLFIGSALAGRGHDVVAVDRDTWPPPGRWSRPGVMQFHHAHGFRTQVGRALGQEWPSALDAWLGLGAEPIMFDLPGVGPVPAGHRSRRDTFERALRSTAETVPRLSIRQGHVDGLLSSEGRVRGVVVDGSPVEADLVVDASGRSGRSVDGLRAPATTGGPCGMAYVDRQYRLRDGAEPGPMSNQLAWQADFDGYQVLVFLHEQGHFSVVLVRPTADAALKGLRHQAAFEAACGAVPGLAAWTDPERASPVTDVLPGGPLHNTYRGQRARDGRPCMPGLVSVGDAVATTTPIFGRGVATTFLQVLQLLALLDTEPDPGLVGEPFDEWCEDNMLPWVVDHVEMDGDTVRRWEGGGVDVTKRLPSDLILAAAAREPGIERASGGYLSMMELPSCLDPVEPLARAVYESGWRPAFTPGPSRRELRDVIAAALRKDGVDPTPE